MERLRNVEPLQQNRGVALGRVAVFVADDAFELAEAHAVRVGQRRLGVQPLAFFERLPEPVVAHDHGVDHANAIERELVLSQHAELAGTVDGAALRQRARR